MNIITDAYGDRKVRDVMQNTWGHLAPIPGKKYYGWILLACTVYGDDLILDWDFEDLDGSPWQQAHFNAFVDDYMNDQVRCGRIFDPGVYRYNGWYKVFKNGNFQFKSGGFVKQKISS